MFLIQFIMKYFNEINQLIYKTAFYLAIESDDVDLVKLLLTNEKIDINQSCIKKK